LKIQGKMGARDHPPLPEDSLPVGGNPDRFARRRRHRGEAGQEQAEAVEPRHGGQVGPGAPGRQVRGMFRSHSEGTQECI